MASIQVGGGQGRRALDSELPLVPFIDLLLCCVMFLLVSAVWNQISELQVRPPPGPSSVASALRGTQLTLSLTADAWVLVTPEGARFPFATGDLVALREALAARHATERELAIATDDGVPYETVVSVIDVAIGEGLSDVTMAGDGAH